MLAPFFARHVARPDAGRTNTTAHRPSPVSTTSPCFRTTATPPLRDRFSLANSGRRPLFYGLLPETALGTGAPRHSRTEPISASNGGRTNTRTHSLTCIHDSTIHRDCTPCNFILCAHFFAYLHATQHSEPAGWQQSLHNWLKHTLETRIY